MTDDRQSRREQAAVRYGPRRGDAFGAALMACWQQGDREQALRWFARGNAWMEQHHPEHEELLRFRAEATALLDSHPLPV